MKSSDTELRIDRWLYFTRFYKTRTKASAAVTGGHVKINGERATAGNRVQRGDIIDLLRDRLPYRLSVVEIPLRRGPAGEAQQCYEEDSEVVEQRQSLSDSLRQDRLLMPRTPGRPDKRTRRLLRSRVRE